MNDVSRDHTVASEGFEPPKAEPADLLAKESCQTDIVKIMKKNLVLEMRFRP